MAYDEELSQYFEKRLEGLQGLSDKRMMGGHCFFLNGNMIGGAHRDKNGQRWFMFRVGKDNVEDAEKLEGGEPMVLGGRRFAGFYMLNQENSSDALFRQWLALALSFVSSLPPKEKD